MSDTEELEQLKFVNRDLRKRLTDLQNEEEEREILMKEEKLEQKLAMGRLKQELLEQKKANIVLLDENQFLKNTMQDNEKKHAATVKRLESKVSEMNAELLSNQLSHQIQQLTKRHVSAQTETETERETVIPDLVDNPNHNIVRDCEISVVNTGINVSWAEELQLWELQDGNASESVPPLQPTLPIPMVTVTPPTPVKPLTERALAIPPQPSRCQPKHQIRIVGSSMVRNVARELSSMLPSDYAVTGTCLPNAKFEEIISEAERASYRMGDDDCLIVMGGMNNVLNGQGSHLFALDKVNEMGQRTNVILSELRYLYRRSPEKRKNESIYFQNAHIINSALFYNVLEISDMGVEFCAKDGIHPNNYGKTEIAHRIKTLIFKGSGATLSQGSMSVEVIGQAIPVVSSNRNDHQLATSYCPPLNDHFLEETWPRYIYRKQHHQIPHQIPLEMLM